jgi:CheY-like chemotaxis protein
MSSSKPPISTVIAEDNPALLELLTGMLDGIDGIRIVGSAASEADAIALIQATRPQLAIVDLELREGTGLKVLSAIQNMPSESGSTRVVVSRITPTPLFAPVASASGPKRFSTNHSRWMNCWSSSTGCPAPRPEASLGAHPGRIGAAGYRGPTCHPGRRGFQVVGRNRFRKA